LTKKGKEKSKGQGNDKLKTFNVKAGKSVKEDINMKMLAKCST